jgi:hypothetical protein
MTPEFHRIRRLPPYVFEEVNRIKARLRGEGVDIIDFGMGNPDMPTPKHIVEKMIETARDPKAGRYSASKGIIGLRRAMAGYYDRRFGVKLDPDTEVIATLGSKEGFANLAQALTAPGDVIICPNPAYPIHAYGFIMAGGVIRHVPGDDHACPPGDAAGGDADDVDPFDPADRTNILFGGPGAVPHAPRRRAHHAGLRHHPIGAHQSGIPAEDVFDVVLNRVSQPDAVAHRHDEDASGQRGAHRLAEDLLEGELALDAEAAGHERGTGPRDRRQDHRRHRHREQADFHRVPEHVGKISLGEEIPPQHLEQDHLEEDHEHQNSLVAGEQRLEGQ